MRSLYAVLMVIVGAVALISPYPGNLFGAEEKQKATDCYGDELPPGAVLRLGTARFRENFRCYAVAYSPDGKLLASAGDGGVVLWEAESGKRRGFLASRVTSTGVSMGVDSRMFVCSLAFSHDGRYLAAACEEETVVWELATRKVFYLPSEKGRKTATDLVGFTPDNRGVITGDANVIQVREIQTGKTLKRWEFTFSRDHWYWLKVLSADGKRVVAVINEAKGKNSLHVWDIAGDETRKIETVTGSLALSPDKTIVAVLHGEEKLTLVDLASGKEIRSWSVERAERIQSENVLPGAPPFPEIAFSPNGKSLATKGFLWSVATGRKLYPLEGDEEATFGLCFSPDGKQLATGKKSRIELWDTNTGKKIHDFPNHKGTVKDLAYSPNGRQLVTAGFDSLRLWDVQTGKLIRSFKKNGKDVYSHSVTFLPDGRRLVAEHSYGIAIWNVADGRLLREISEPEFAIRSIAVTPDGKAILAAGDEHHAAKPECRHIREWDVVSGKERHRFGAGKTNIFSIAISPDGKIVAAASDDGIVRLWNRATGKLVSTMHNAQSNRSTFQYHLAFAPDGNLLAAVCGDGGTIDLGDVTIGRFRSEIVPYLPYAGAEPRIAFSVAAHRGGRTRLLECECASRAKLRLA